MRKRIAVWAWLALGAACGHESSTATPDLSVGGFQTSDCGVCVAQACQQQIQACSNDPSCTARYACLLSCPTAMNGDADPTCEARCPSVSGATGMLAAQELADCRVRGAGALCAACGHLPKDDGGTQNPILNQQCPPSTETNPCWKCEAEHCCNTEQACLADADCQTLKKCISGCQNADGGADGMDACSYACWQSAPRPAAAKLAAIETCVVVFCNGASLCGPLDDCSSCDVQQCLNTFVACKSDLDCNLIGTCIGACPFADGPCIDNCVQTHPNGAKLFDDEFVCSTSRCAQQCAP
jgi:hypothetical protein